MTHGFTQRGCTGMIVPVAPLPTLPEFDGLKTSALALALTEFPVLPHIREKNVGKLARVTCTVTVGLLTPEAKGKAEQSVELLPAAEYVTLTVPTAMDPTVLCIATEVAA